MNKVTFATSIFILPKIKTINRYTMKRFLSFVTMMVLTLSGVTSCYDDSSLWESVNDHEERLKRLETLCNEMNTNIQSLLTLANAAKSSDYITDMSPIM